MSENLKFREEDKKQLVEFLNMVANHASFNMKTQELIRYFKLLTFMQTELLPKIDSHVFEIKKVTEDDNNK